MTLVICSNHSKIKIVMILFLSLMGWGQADLGWAQDKILSNEDDPLSLIRETQSELMEEVWQLVEGQIQKARNKEQPEWNEEEGDDGNMVYDKAVAQDELENEDLFRYLDLIHSGQTNDPAELAQNIVQITKFIAELKEKASHCERNSIQENFIPWPDDFKDLISQTFDQESSFDQTAKKDK